MLRVVFKKRGVLFLIIIATISGCVIRVNRTGDGYSDTSPGYPEANPESESEQPLSVYEQHAQDVLSRGCSDDLDCDRLSNEEEFLVARTFTPVYFYDNQEHDVLTRQPIQEFYSVVFLYQVANAVCSLEGESNFSTGERITFTIVASYTNDYVPMEGLTTFGSEEDTFAHYGDTERIMFCLERNGEAQDLNYSVSDIVYVLINRHGESEVYLVDEFETEASHIVVYVSEGKHAAYKSKSECEDDVFYARVFWDEDCSGGSSAIQMLPTIREDLNVGSSHHHLIDFTDQIEVLKPVFSSPEAIWNDVSFCGGYNIPAREADRDIYGPYSGPVCAGSLGGKWVK